MNDFFDLVLPFPASKARKTCRTSRSRRIDSGRANGNVASVRRPEEDPRAEVIANRLDLPREILLSPFSSFSSPTLSIHLCFDDSERIMRKACCTDSYLEWRKSETHNRSAAWRATSPIGKTCQIDALGFSARLRSKASSPCWQPIASPSAIDGGSYPGRANDWERNPRACVNASEPSASARSGRPWIKTASGVPTSPRNRATIWIALAVEQTVDNSFPSGSSNARHERGISPATRTATPCVAPQEDPDDGLRLARAGVDLLPQA